MSETPLLPFVADAPCNCESAYAEDEDGNCTSAGLCQKCLVRNGHCECSAEAQCVFCVEREPFRPTQEDAEIAEATSLHVWEHIERLRIEWIAERERRVAKWGRAHLEGELGSCDCGECLLSPTSMKRYNEAIRLQFQGVLELPLWYNAWQKNSPVHMDPSAWTSKRAWRLVWNAQRLSFGSDL